MNNIERPVDDNSTVSIQDNEKLKQVERKETKKQQQKKKKKSGITIRELTIIGLLAGITIALGVSGYGIIPLGPLNVTTLHVPTLIGAIVEGPKVGAFVGFIFGCYSLWQNITAPNILSPLFINPIISVFTAYTFPCISILGISLIVESAKRSTYYRFCIYGDRIPYNYGYGINLCALCRYVRH